MAESGGTPSYAFATLVTSDHYLPGALAVAGALKDLHPSPAVSPEVDFQTVCIVTPESVDVSTIKQLRQVFNLVVGVEIIAQRDDSGLKLLGRLDLNTVLTKLHVFRLTQFSKIIFLDADVLPVRPLSHLFTLPHEFSAVPDVGWPDIFNSGVLVLSPGEEKFNELNELLKSRGTWDGGDQGILNEWRGNDWNRLSFTYNTTPTAAYTYAPAYARFGSQISAIHFIGPSKPWKTLPTRTPFQSSQRSGSDTSRSTSGALEAYDYNSLVDRWFAVYDKHYRTDTTGDQFDFEVQHYPSVWDGQVGDAGSWHTQAASTVAAPFSLVDLRRLAIQGQPTNTAASSSVGEGQYMRLPLEGRIHLMRPNESDAANRKPDSVPRVDDLASGPKEALPSPHLSPISLSLTPNHEDSSQEHQHSQHQSSQELDHGQYPQPRPASPPMVAWNPALEPPPTAPPTSAFPSDTYFPNIWDQPVVHQQHYRQGPRAASPPPDSGAFFQPPPPPEIPEVLRQQGHYREVTGGEQGISPTSPDRTKVKSVFPWEEKPRKMPGRVFPAADAPSPSMFTSSGTDSPSTPESSVASLPRSQPLSPLGGLPATLAYVNAWDTVPSIQKYASRLVRPSQSTSLAPAFDSDEWRKGKSWEDRVEASSMDGDDEDTSGDDDESLDDAQSSTPMRSRASSISATYSIKGKNKEYTVTTQRRSSRQETRRPWTSTAVTTPVDSKAAMVSSPISAGPTSPREFNFDSPTTRNNTEATPPPRTAVQATSPASVPFSTNDTSLTSPPSSIGPISPPDAPLVPPARKGSRVWDPARGVDVFKRGSEEVLARFLKMRSWEEDAAA
ncbi:unnamed protein product [Mycena citricolor]|uniref:glycogenin glucosyltransferase n=1 Tax=Mycena citricolor TaxID=2018698 RepID=A0AAD2GXY8_9AGAR|nr:unnamed protein product [Mycena citricolor]